MTKSTGVGRGGARPGSGPKRKPRTARITVPTAKAVVKPVVENVQIADAIAKATVDSVQELAKSHTALAIEVLAAIARDGEKEAARVAAANALLDRAHGKPAGSAEAPGKKVMRKAAASGIASGGGRFATPGAPKLVVDNR